MGVEPTSEVKVTSEEKWVHLCTVTKGMTLSYSHTVGWTADASVADHINYSYSESKTTTKHCTSLDNNDYSFYQQVCLMNINMIY